MVTGFVHHVVVGFVIKAESMGWARMDICLHAFNANISVSMRNINGYLLILTSISAHL